MSAAPTRKLTPTEYLELDRISQERSQYYLGDVFAMAGGSKNHNRIARNLLLSFETQFRRQLRRCEAFAADLRLQVDSRQFYTYPDVMVTCGEPRFLDHRDDTLLNPVVIVEVLSPSTEAFDRGKKFELYRHLESLQTYILIAQDQPLVESFHRQADGSWTLVLASGLASQLEIPAVEAQIPLSELNLDVKSPEDPAGPTRQD
jgi:Uma2 family endonuclease